MDALCFPFHNKIHFNNDLYTDNKKERKKERKKEISFKNDLHDSY